MRVAIKRRADGLYLQQHWRTDKITGWTADIHSGRAYQLKVAPIQADRAGLQRTDIEFEPIDS